MGLAASIPLILQKYHITYTDQAIFSNVSWPYSMKLLWAPIVDSIFLKSYGRRKTWIIPVQLIVGSLLIIYSFRINSLLTNPEGPYIYTLTILFFVLYFLVATQVFNLNIINILLIGYCCRWFSYFNIKTRKQRICINHKCNWSNSWLFY